MKHSIIVCDSITHVIANRPVSPVVICGSHGGIAAAIYAIQKHVKGAIFNDAGRGKEQAGIAGLGILERYGIIGACVDATTACIGLGAETNVGTISYVNRLAQKAGLQPGQKANEAAKLMTDAFWEPKEIDDLELPEEKETIIKESRYGRSILALDSNSMIKSEHKNFIVLTGSHGGLVGNLPAVKYPVRAVFYNDAGVGKNNAGITRLPWLQAHGIIGITVDAESARIGIGLDTFEKGVISFVNRLGLAAGIEKGMAAEKAAKLLFESLSDIV